MSDNAHISTDPYRTARPVQLQHIVFDDRPDFMPELSPKAMLRLGVFNGYFFRGEANNFAEFPMDWLAGARITEAPRRVNCFGVFSPPQEVWNMDGIVATDPDPLGWFQWYMRFTLGRRIDEVDRVQIARWASRRARVYHDVNLNATSPHDMLNKRQMLLEWAIDPQPDVRRRTGG